MVNGYPSYMSAWIYYKLITIKQHLGICYSAYKVKKKQK